MLRAEATGQRSRVIDKHIHNDDERKEIAEEEEEEKENSRSR